MATPKELSDLEAQVTANTDVEASAVALINGFTARIEAAVAKALADNPALTAADLQAVTDANNSLKASGDALGAAVAANT